MKTVFVFSLLFVLGALNAPLYAQDTLSTKITKPDTNFKSIHQYQYETYEESLKIHTPIKDSEKAAHDKQNNSNNRVIKIKQRNFFVIASLGFLLLVGVLLLFLTVIPNRREKP